MARSRLTARRVIQTLLAAPPATPPWQLREDPGILARAAAVQQQTARPAGPSNRFVDAAQKIADFAAVRRALTAASVVRTPSADPSRLAQLVAAGARGRGGTGVDMKDFRYGANTHGESDESILARARRFAPQGSTPMHIMNQGWHPSGMPDGTYAIKYATPSGNSTYWVKPDGTLVPA